MEVWEISRYGMAGHDRRRELEDLGFTIVRVSVDTLQVTPPSPEWKIEHFDVFSEIMEPDGVLRVIDHHRPSGPDRWLEIRRD